MSDTALSERSADVIVVGAGPAGSTTAYYLAKSGLDVLLLEKTAFPREKVCGDGLTPRATKQLVSMGIDISEEAGWLRNKGLRIISGGMRLQMDWPELAAYPDYGLVRKREDFDDLLAQQAVKAGARLYERCNVGAPIIDERTGRITGVTAKLGEDEDRRPPSTRRWSSPPTATPPGSRSRWACTGATTGRWASRCARTSPRRGTRTTTWSPGWNCGTGAAPSPANCPATAGSSARRRHVQRRPRHPQLLRRLPRARLARGAQGVGARSMPEEWGYTPENMTEPIRGAALPMALQPPAALHPRPAAGRRRGRPGQPVQRRGHRLRDGVRPDRRRRDHPGARPCHRRPSARWRSRAYPRILKETYGGYYNLGRALREADRQPEGPPDLHAARADPPDADEVLPQAPGEPHGPDAAATRWTASSTASPRSPPAPSPVRPPRASRRGRPIPRAGGAPEVRTLVRRGHPRPGAGQRTLTAQSGM